MSIEASVRLQRIVDSIRTETAFKNHYADPQRLVDRMAQLHTPAVSIAVIDDYQIASVGAYGTCEAGDQRLATQDSLFLAGSISKPVFAAAVMYLVQSGEIDLDKDVNHYLKSWKIPANSGWQPHITLRQLLSHTSGLTVHGFPGYQTSEDIPTICQVLSGEWPANTPKVEVNILPGMQFRYSGGGTTVAQLAMTDHLNDSFAALIKRLVFEPLGMRSSTFENPLPSRSLPMAAVAHPSKNIPLRGGHHIYPESAAAGLWTTATDLAIFGLALQTGLRGAETSFLQKKTIETMLSPQLAHEKNSTSYVGLGFFCQDSGRQATFGHSGWDEGFVAELKLYRHEGKGAVVMLNSNEGYPLIDEIMRAIAEEFDWPGLSDHKSVIQLPEPDLYVGQYKSEASQVFSIEHTQGGLLLQYDMQPPVFFQASSKLNFFSQIVNTKLLFEQDDQGAITALTIEQEGIQRKAVKCQ